MSAERAYGDAREESAGGGQLSLYPSGLPRGQFEHLNGLAKTASALSLDAILDMVDEHLSNARQAYEINHLVNVSLAAAIAGVIRQVVEQWVAIPAMAKSWLKAAMLYFINSDDDEPDFNSPIGFEDDAEVLNACLRFADLDELCVNPEEYDDV
jgi:uncharacterized membrane protein YkvA (DUF1232 family)